MTSIQEIALDIYGNSDFSDLLNREGLKEIAETCVGLAFAMVDAEAAELAVRGRTPNAQ